MEKKVAVIINCDRQTKTIPKVIENILPYRVCREIEALSDRYGYIEEIRLRCNRCASVSVRGKNILLSSLLIRGSLDVSTPHITTLFTINTPRFLYIV